MKKETRKRLFFIAIKYYQSDFVNIFPHYMLTLKPVYFLFLLLMI